MDVAYKLTLLLKRRADLEPEQFADAWLDRDRRDPLVAPGLVRYVFNRALPGSAVPEIASSASCDAVIETWWTRKNDAADWIVSRGFEETWLPPRQTLLAERPAAVAGEPLVVWERETTEGMEPVTAITLPVARRSLRVGEFAAEWTGRHAELALGGPHTRDRLVRLEFTPAPLAPPSRFLRTRYDGVGAITFASIGDLVDEFGSDWHRAKVAADERRLSDPIATAVFVGARIDLT